MWRGFTQKRSSTPPIERQKWPPPWFSRGPQGAHGTQKASTWYPGFSVESAADSQGKLIHSQCPAWTMPCPCRGRADGETWRRVEAAAEKRIRRWTLSRSFTLSAVSCCQCRHHSCTGYGSYKVRDQSPLHAQESFRVTMIYPSRACPCNCRPARVCECWAETKEPLYAREVKGRAPNAT